ncbi:MAG: hypothetical protein FWC41_06415 [Firmicutes bacterium]|nr:hypothetical protein [Bacillota bacterium]
METKIISSIENLFPSKEEQLLIHNFIEKLNSMPLNFSEPIYNQLMDEIIKLCINFKRISIQSTFQKNELH